jgi:multiple sugar transport system substrate-binding protein
MLRSKQMQPTLSRRNFLKATATVLGSTFLVACVAPPAAPAGTEPSAPAEAPGSQGEVTMVAFPLTQDDVALMRPIQDAFMEANPGITVQVQIDPWDGRENKMLAALAAGNPPNAVYLNPDFYPKFVESDVLVAFNDLLAEGFMDDYLPGPISAVQYNDNIFGLPILTSAYTQAYNKQLVEAAGITEAPANWETFRAAIEQVHNPDAGIWGATYDLNRPSPVTTFVPFLRMAGGNQFTEDGSDIAFDGPEGLEALNYLVSFYRDELVQQSNISGGGIPFSSGQIGYMIQTQNSEIKRIMQENPDLEIGVCPTLEHVEKSNFGTVGSYAIFKPSANHEATAKWLEFLTNPENTLTIIAASGFISPRASIAPEQYAEGVFAEVAAQAPFMRSEPKHLKAREVMAAQRPEFEAAYLGEKTVEVAMADAAAAARKILAE